MNKKIIFAIFFIAIFIVGAIPISGDLIDVQQDIKEKLIKNIDFFIDDNNGIGNFGFISIGPVSKLYVKLESIEGTESNVELIQNCMNKRPPFIARILPTYPIFASRINFILSFKIDVKISPRKMYLTGSGEYIFNENGIPVDIVNLTYYRNEIHRVKVTNFTGIFVYNKAQLIKGILPRPKNLLWPARFSFMGVADNVEYL